MTINNFIWPFPIGSCILSFFISSLSNNQILLLLSAIVSFSLWSIHNKRAKLQSVFLPIYARQNHIPNLIWLLHLRTTEWLWILHFWFKYVYTVNKHKYISEDWYLHTIIVSFSALLISIFFLRNRNIVFQTWKWILHWSDRLLRPPLYKPYNFRRLVCSMEVHLCFQEHQWC